MISCSRLDLLLLVLYCVRGGLSAGAALAAADRAGPRGTPRLPAA
jgi:hypothetical protein